MSSNTIFVTADRYLSSEIPGGVQICTRDYIRLLETCRLHPIFCPVAFTKRIWKRAKIRFGVDIYDRYDFDAIAQEVIHKIHENQAKYVAINQVSLIKLLPILRKHFGNQIVIIVLSHGNESGDFLHEITYNHQRGFFRLARDVTKLGFLIHYEALYFTRYADVVLSMSETDKEINRWLGAKQSIFVPRVFEPRFLDWRPDLNRVGFVGTLDHRPNHDGLEGVLQELRDLDHGRLKVRVVGGPALEGVRLARDYPMVEYLGHLRDRDLEQEAATWAIFLNPILWYARGSSTKLAQGISWGLPIASTPAGNRGYSWKEGSLLVGKSAKELAQLIVESTKSEDTLREMAAGVRAIARSGPTYAEIAERVRAAL